MCKAWDGAMQMYAEEASERTRKEVTNELTKRHACKMYKKGISIEDIAGILERPAASIRDWCENVQKQTASA